MDTALHQQPMLFLQEGIATITPQQADYIVTQHRYDRQRDEMRAVSHIAALAEQMTRGVWLPRTQIDFARLGGRLILVNGHHRLRAQSRANVAIVWNIVIHDVRNEEELRSLYWRFDMHVRKRSAENILQGIGLAEDLGMRKNTATSLWGAVPIISRGMNFTRYQNAETPMLPDERVEMCREYADEALFMEAAMDAAPLIVRRRLLVASRMALALVTLRHCPDRAADFWVGVCSDDGLKRNDPRKVFLIGIQSTTKKDTPLASLIGAARTWNAWHGSKTLTHVKMGRNDVPISGTPYTVQV